MELRLWVILIIFSHTGLQDMLSRRFHCGEGFFQGFVFFTSVLVFQLSFNQLKKVFSSFLKIWMAKDVSRRVFSRFVEIIHVELSNERMDIAMPEVIWQNIILESIRISDSKFFAGSKPVNDLMILRILDDILLT